MSDGGDIEAPPAVGGAPGWWRERSDGLGIAQSLALKLLHREQAADSKEAVNLALRMALGREEAEAFQVR